MAELNLDSVIVFVGSPDQNIRTTTITVIRNAGFRDIEHGTTLESVRAQLQMRPIDLLFCETAFPDGDPCDLVRDLRHHDVGANPFLSIIMLTWEPSVDLVNKVVNSGADDLLVKPLSVSQIVQRVGAQIKSRKGFMVTSDYIGPDRRRGKARPDDGKPGKIPPIDVPNMLRAKVTGEESPAEIQKAIDETLKQINSRKLEGHAVKVTQLVAQILPAYRENRVDGDVKRKLDNLVFVAEDSARRLVDTEYDHVADLCNSLVQVSNDICGSWKSPDPKDLKLLEPVARAIETAFTVGKEDADLARRITDEIAHKQA